MLKKIKGLFIEEEGQGLTEYGLIIGLVAVVVLNCLTALGANRLVQHSYTKLQDELKHYNIIIVIRSPAFQHEKQGLFIRKEVNNDLGKYYSGNCSLISSILILNLEKY